jgi:hypothetical protein
VDQDLEAAEDLEAEGQHLEEAVAVGLEGRRREGAAAAEAEPLERLGSAWPTASSASAPLLWLHPHHHRRRPGRYSTGPWRTGITFSDSS